jgi:catechol 2,3-dioxygenase-like lactoylglutathione lyase family enzyme
MTASVTPVFHVGFLVKDIEKACRSFHELLGANFNEPHLLRMEHMEDPEPMAREVLFTYSREGPVHFELIEGQDNDGIWSIRQGEGLHHVGLWAHGAEEKLAEFRAAGYRSTTRMLNDARSVLAWYVDPRDAHGVRIEFIDDMQREAVERYIATGERV